MFRDTVCILAGAAVACAGMVLALSAMQYASLYAMNKLVNQFLGG